MPVVSRKVLAIMATTLVAAQLCLAMPAVAGGQTSNVVASIRPVHALVAQVMAGVGAPRLLMTGGASPHAYVLKPSDARAISVARAVFWIGPGLERFLVNPLMALAADVRVVPLARADGVRVLPARTTGAWADDHDHDHANSEAGQQHGATDPHLWLDPVNAAAMVRAIVAALAAVDAANAPRYRANGDRALADLRALEAELATTVAPVKHVPYVVFHDAYQYFERRFGLAAVGAIAVGTGRAPGARRISELRQTILARRAACVFIEPQFEPVLARTLIENTGARLGTLDPLGAALKPGPGLYGELMRGLARSLVGCLRPRAG